MRAHTATLYLSWLKFIVEQIPHSVEPICRWILPLASCVQRLRKGSRCNAREDREATKKGEKGIEERLRGRGKERKIYMETATLEVYESWSQGGFPPEDRPDRSRLGIAAVNARPREQHSRQLDNASFAIVHTPALLVRSLPWPPPPPPPPPPFPYEGVARDHYGSPYKTVISVALTKTYYRYTR